MYKRPGGKEIKLAKEIGDGYKLIYSSTNNNGRNGVGIIFNKDMKTKVINVNRVSDKCKTRIRRNSDKCD